MNAAKTDVPPQRSDRRQLRRNATKDEIVAAAWVLVRENGLAGLNMRDLGESVGMRAQSVYSYFASKHEIYDAMFREGYLAFLEAMAPLLSLESTRDALNRDPDARRRIAREIAHRFFDFCTSDPVRYQLLFQRTVPDFVPSDASYAVALQVDAAQRASAHALGVVEPEDFDLFTAVLTGLVDQQLSNDPGGVRWQRLLDRAVDILLDAIPVERLRSQTRHKQSKPRLKKERATT